MTLRSCALGVAVALSLAGCSDGPSPVTATRVLEVAGLRAVVNAVALSPDGSLVVVGDMDGDLIAREVPAGAERWKVPVHPRGAARSIDGVAFSPDGSLLATIGHGARTVELWEAATGRQAAVLSIGQSRGSAFHPTERVLVVVGGTTIHLVDLERGEVVRTLPNAHQGDRIDAVRFPGDRRRLAVRPRHPRPRPAHPARARGQGLQRPARRGAVLQGDGARARGQHGGAAASRRHRGPGPVRRGGVAPDVPREVRAPHFPFRSDIQAPTSCSEDSAWKLSRLLTP